MTEKMTESEQEKWPKTIFPSHTIGRDEDKIKGFTIVEATDSTQIERSLTYWFPELVQKFVPIYDSVELLQIFQEVTS
jgi:hypothetical protein